jgi:DNA-binding NtrC family response regulator
MRVLVLARDQITQDFLVALIDAAGHESIAASVLEPVVEALERVQSAVALIDLDVRDVDRAVAASQSFGAQVILFSSSRDAREVAEAAARFGVPYFAAPIDSTRFAELLAQAAQAWTESRSIRFVDSQGRRWYVRELAENQLTGHRARSLMFVKPSQEAGGHVARRVWSYPPDWRNLSAAELESLSEGPPGEPQPSS